MATAEEQVGAAFAEQIKQMQAEGAAFSPVNDKLKEAQDRILQGLLDSTERGKAPPDAMAQNEDYQWVMLHLRQNPLIIPYMRRQLEKVLTQLRADIEASLAKSLGL